jgi:hypothetical protein
MKELLLIAILAVGLIITPSIVVFIWAWKMTRKHQKDYGYDNRLFEEDRR